MINNDFGLIFRSLPMFLKGTLVTIQVFILSGTLSITLGLFFGILMSSKIKVSTLARIIEGITFITRGIPFFVQLLIVYFVIPDLLKITINPFAASVLALGVCSSGYVAQFARGAIDAVPLVHWETAFTLGYSKRRTLLCIILPQTFRVAIPALTNELDSLLKSTAIISSIGMLDLTRIGMNIVSREMEPVPVYLSLAFIYLCMSALLNFTAKTLERKLAYVNS